MSIKKHLATSFLTGTVAFLTVTNTFATQIENVGPGIQPDSYDYRDYSTSASSKTFALSGNFCGDIETRTFSRTVSGANTEITMSRVRTSLGTVCHNKNFHSLATPDAYLLLDKENNNLSGVLISTDSLTTPIVLRTSAMTLGADFGTSSEIIRTPVGGTGTLNDLMVHTNSLLGVEDVAVPAGNYTACLKIHMLRTSATFGRFNRVSWYCPGVGEVKRMQSESLGETGFRIWELQSITP